jgi:hypothetical protein
LNNADYLKLPRFIDSIGDSEVMILISVRIILDTFINSKRAPQEQSDNDILDTLVHFLKEINAIWQLYLPTYFSSIDDSTKSKQLGGETKEISKILNLLLPNTLKKRIEAHRFV